MIPVTASTEIMVAIEPVDFRRQTDGLVAHCRQALSANPMTGTLFVFINRARTMIRVLVYDGGGFWLMNKRLSKGKFTGWPTSNTALAALPAKALMQRLRTPSAQSTLVACSGENQQANKGLQMDAVL